MPEIERPRHGTRVPPPAGGIQVNFCKNPTCDNFGVPASIATQPRGRGRRGDGYQRDPRGGRNAPGIECMTCHQRPTMKSNLAIKEELDRLTAHIDPSRAPITCPNEECINNNVDITAGRDHYYSHGTTRAGSRRYRCRMCGKLFSAGRPTLGQKKPYKNIPVFKCLVNKSPMRRACSIAGVAASTLYHKLDFLHRQCMAFAGAQEKKLIDGMALPALAVGVDRQDYTVNWSQTTDKRNIILHAVASAENRTGYVFGASLNFDPTLDPKEVEADAETIRDREYEMPFRRYARVWTEGDYEQAVASRRQTRRRPPQSHEEKIRQGYENALERDDIEVSETQNRATALPKHGMQVHAEYTIYGHFFLLKKLLSGSDNIVFYLDGDSGIRAACLSAFADRVKDGAVEAFFVSIISDMTVPIKRELVREGKREFRRIRRQNLAMSDKEIVLAMFEERIRRATPIGPFGDKWVKHPLPKMSEPMTKICHLTDTRRLDMPSKALLHSLASRHGVDRFFMQVRRMINLLERPIATPRNRMRKWFGYSPYNPAVVQKMLDIFRVYYNYCKPGKDKQTPAMRLGLTNAKTNLGEIVNFMPVDLGIPATRSEQLLLRPEQLLLNPKQLLLRMNEMDE